MRKVIRAHALSVDRHIGPTGGLLATEAPLAGFVDELVRHQVPRLLGDGRPSFHHPPEQVHLGQRPVNPTPSLTHLPCEVVR